MILFILHIKELDKLFFHDERLNWNNSDLRNRILAETPQSSYSCFQEFWPMIE